MLYVSGLDIVLSTNLVQGDKRCYNFASQ